jgi:hypothetical protein
MGWSRVSGFRERLVYPRVSHPSKNIVLGKKAWVMVLAFIFMRGHDQSGDIAKEIHSLDRENFNVFLEERRFPQTAKPTDISVSSFFYRKPSEASRQVKLHYALEQHIYAGWKSRGFGAPKKQLTVPNSIFPDLKFAIGIDDLSLHTVQSKAEKDCVQSVHLA